MAAAAKKKPAAKKAPAKKVAAKAAPVKTARRAVVEAAPETAPPTRARRTLVDDSVEADVPTSATATAQAASDYFARVDKDGIKFVSAGCALIDATIGGGWPLGRMVNIVGDKSAGKTLLAIEACANFARQYLDGYIRYAEAEAAFDVDYAEALGMPVDRVDFEPGDPEKGLTTVEDFYADMLRCLDKCKAEGRRKARPMLYVLDSLDALSDDAEAGRDIDKGSFGAAKAKKMGELFRRLVQRMEEQDCLLIIVSQLRDKIGVTFGETQTRSGGRALDFYASLIVWLREIGKNKRTVGGIERITGVNVRMKVKKNKVGLPFRECDYPIVFGYGVDDLTASVEWLLEVKREKRLGEVGMSKDGYKVRIGNLRNKGGDAMREVRAQLDAIVREEWRAIETTFLPQSRKY